MTVRAEIELRLKAMLPDEYGEFRRATGGGPDQIVWNAAIQREDIKAVLMAYDGDQPGVRSKICALLNLPTPDERQQQLNETATAAAESAAESARKSEGHATDANRIARRSFGVAVVAVLIAFFMPTCR